MQIAGIRVSTALYRRIRAGQIPVEQIRVGRIGSADMRHTLMPGALVAHTRCHFVRNGEETKGHLG